MRFLFLTAAALALTACTPPAPPLATPHNPKEPFPTPIGFPHMDKQPTYAEPTDVTAEEGRVLLDGPDGVDVALTVEAAAETSDRLLAGAAKAAGQRRLATLDHRPK